MAAEKEKPGAASAGFRGRMSADDGPPDNSAGARRRLAGSAGTDTPAIIQLRRVELPWPGRPDWRPRVLWYLVLAGSDQLVVLTDKRLLSHRALRRAARETLGVDLRPCADWALRVLDAVWHRTTHDREAAP